MIKGVIKAIIDGDIVAELEYYSKEARRTFIKNNDSLIENGYFLITSNNKRIIPEPVARRKFTKEEIEIVRLNINNFGRNKMAKLINGTESSTRTIIKKIRKENASKKNNT